MILIDRDKVLKTIPNEEMVARMAVMSAPTVDAIPVNWLTNLAKEYEKSDNQFFRMDSCVIEDLIKSWKEEQGKNNDS